jgi:sialate O-acetylesterase
VEGFASIGLDPQTDEISNKKAGKLRDSCQLPSRLWNEMVNPFAPMAMRGMIWYQGCSNSGDAPERYTRMMHALYNGWSKKFENPGMKLYFVQLAPWGSGGHPEFQQAQQRFAEEQPNSAMAVINDLGNLTDIHPSDKEPVARRLVLHALKRDYGFSNIEDCSPVLRSWRIEGDRFVMTFDHAKSFYVYNHKYCSQENGFEICGADGAWKKCQIHNFIRNSKGNYRGGIAGGNVLEVSADGVAEPKKLRYLYSRPWYGSVYNEVCLPLGSFHIDASDSGSKKGK